MSWTSGLLTQAANTSVRWTTTGSALSSHDVVVAGPVSAPAASLIELQRTQIGLSPLRYVNTVFVSGPVGTSVRFRFYAEQIN